MTQDFRKISLLRILISTRIKNYPSITSSVSQIVEAGVQLNMEQEENIFTIRYYRVFDTKVKKITRLLYVTC